PTPSPRQPPQTTRPHTTRTCPTVTTRTVAVLTKAEPLHLWVVLDQAVLQREVGGRQVMAAQIDHLIEQAQRPNIDIQILPWSAGAHAAGVGHCVTITAGGITSAYIEMLSGGLYLDTAEGVKIYTTAIDYLHSQAADTTASLQIMSAASEEYRK
ncbi:DUF5753 domain-containing protein, partial [Streptomyces sp. NPDC059534]|uniref:DUF5753 domain-containing protein n=1 Tax=Streptomyces sp. NPDC059534 TaxID=3346859 RepID=UPI0036817BA5